MQLNSPPDFEALNSMGYTRIKESTYSFDHPEVKAWTEFFEQETLKRNIFSRFFELNPVPSSARAVAVGTQWHRFSEFMPWFLCQAAALVPTNPIRHYVIQTAFEELGMRDSTEIHSDLFWRTTESVGVTCNDRQRLSQYEPVSSALNFLKEELLGMKNYAEILGIMLGLEIPAKENIEAIFLSLSNSKLDEAKLRKTKFFTLHRQIEIEHVRLNVANFLRFCPEISERDLFLVGFNKGLMFWEQFWSGISQLISLEKLNCE